MLQGQALYGDRRAQGDDGILALGRNLFANLPEDEFDRGPQARAEYRLIADVRLDNRAELIRSLGLGTSDHAKLCDAALLFESLLKWGADAADRLIGEFAFALWNGATRELLMGRDFLGFRPLYFHQGKDFFAFASMPSGLHSLDDVPYDLDTEYMVERLALLPVVGRRSYFKDIERVEPGHVVRVNRAGIASERFWNPPSPSTNVRQPEIYEEGLRVVLDEAVSAQLRGVGDSVASQLSAGLDSSTVTATVARLMPEGKVVAYTGAPRFGFDGPTPYGMIANETDLARATARLYPNIEHVVFENSGESPLEWLDENFLYQQQPMANLTNAVWGQAIHSDAKSRGLNTIFKASAGNMSISYAGLEWLPLLLRSGRLLRLAQISWMLAKNGMHPRFVGSQTLAPFVPPPVWRRLRGMTGRAPGLIDFSAVNRARLPEIVRKSAERSHDLSERTGKDPHENRVWALTRADGGNAIKGVLAEWGLSVRDPTADRRVIEYCLTVPPQEFVRGGIPRSLARRAFSDRLPPEVSQSRVRGYQSADWYEALDRARPQIEEEIASIGRCSSAAKALDLNWLTGLLESWPEGEWHQKATSARYRLGLLRGISAGHFMRKVEGTN